MEVLKVDQWIYEQSAAQFYCVKNRSKALRIKDGKWFGKGDSIITYRGNILDSGYIVSFDLDNIHVIIRPDIWSSAILVIEINKLD